MGNLKGLLALAALCWLAFLSHLLGTFLKRFAVSRNVGLAIQWQAFLCYLLGLGGTIALIWSLNDRDGWLVLTWLIALFTFVPLFFCSMQFYRVVRKHLSRPADSSP